MTVGKEDLNLKHLWLCFVGIIFLCSRERRREESFGSEKDR